MYRLIKVQRMKIFLVIAISTVQSLRIRIGQQLINQSFHLLRKRQMKLKLRGIKLKRKMISLQILL
jgi:hypothetical protein